MPLSWNIVYLVLFAQALAVGLALVPPAERVGRRLGLIDAPGERKIHSAPVPRSGGIGIVAALTLVVAMDVGAALLLESYTDFLPDDVRLFVSNIPSILHRLIGIGAGGAVVFALGLVDDRRPLRPGLKFAVQGLAALLLVAAGIRVNLFLPLPVLGVAVTVFWVILICNSFNLLDNMNGLSSGVAAIIAGLLAWISWSSGERFMVCIYLALAGSILGFWFHNFFGGRIFLGDAGSLFIGFMLAALSVLSTYYERGAPTPFPVLIPLMVMGVPIFDTASVLWIRLRLGRPLFVGDTNHFSHRLVALGMSRRGAVVFIYLVTFVVGLNAVQLKHLPMGPALVLAAQTALIFLLIYLLERASRRRHP
ncbi:MAG: MraY family glycosyltransferase [Candidatus Sumerlaeia bacterium]